MNTVKRYNTICICPSEEVVDDGVIVIEGGCTGPAKITINMPHKMSVKIGLVWSNNLAIDEAILIDADMNDLLTINDEYISVPTK